MSIKLCKNSENTMKKSGTEVKTKPIWIDSKLNSRLDCNLTTVTLRKNIIVENHTHFVSITLWGRRREDSRDCWAFKYFFRHDNINWYSHPNMKNVNKLCVIRRHYHFASFTWKLSVRYTNYFDNVIFMCRVSISIREGYILMQFLHLSTRRFLIFLYPASI